LELQGLNVAEKLSKHAPRPILVNSIAETASSPLSTLLLANILPEVMKQAGNGDRLQLNIPGWTPGSDEE
jgi:hypothetical protein